MSRLVLLSKVNVFVAFPLLVISEALLTAGFAGAGATPGPALAGFFFSLDAMYSRSSPASPSVPVQKAANSSNSSTPSWLTSNSWKSS
jgi:hypothetical protein